MRFCVEWDEWCANEVWMRRVTEPMPEKEALACYRHKQRDDGALASHRNIVLREVPKDAVHHAI